LERAGKKGDEVTGKGRRISFGHWAIRFEKHIKTKETKRRHEQRNTYREGVGGRSGELARIVQKAEPEGQEGRAQKNSKNKKKQQQREKGRVSSEVETGDD